jgi:hypothetical protein
VDGVVDIAALDGSRKAIQPGSTRQPGNAHESSGSAGRLATARKQTRCRAAADRRLMQTAATPAAASTAALFKPASSKIPKKSRAGGSHRAMSSRFVMGSFPCAAPGR